MEVMFFKFLNEAVSRASAAEAIEVVTPADVRRGAPVHLWAKVPPTNMMQIKAEKSVKAWLLREADGK